MSEFNSITTPLIFNASLMRGSESVFVVSAWDGECMLDVQALQKHLADRNSIRVGTHNGGFHADEIVAIAMISLVLDVEVEIVRSRDAATLATCDIVVDVAEGTFDHHRSRCDNVSSAASRVLRFLHNTDEVRDAYPKFFWDSLADVVNNVALQDNGGKMYSRLGYIAALSRASALGEDEDACFNQAFDMARKDLSVMMQNWIAEAPAVEAAQKIVHDNPKADVLVFGPECRATDPKKWMWDEHHPALFYVSPSTVKCDTWDVLCCAVPQEKPEDEYDFFSSRYLLPTEWRGKDAAGLLAAAGLTGSVFCHKQGFMARFVSKDEAVAAAHKAISTLKGEEAV